MPRCPNCGTVIRTSQQEWQDRQRALGRCIVCAAPLTKTDEAAGYTRCLRHRRAEAARAQRAYRRRTAAGSLIKD